MKEKFFFTFVKSLRESFSIVKSKMKMKRFEKASKDMAQEISESETARKNLEASLWKLRAEKFFSPAFLVGRVTNKTKNIQGRIGKKTVRT